MAGRASVDGGRGARALSLLHTLEDALLALLLGGMILLASTQILLRNLFDTGLVWADPLLRVAVLWTGMLGALAASRDGRHIAVDILPRLLGPHARRLVCRATALFTALVAGVLAYHGARLVAMDRADGAVAFAAVPAWACELVIPFALGLIALRYLLMALLGCPVGTPDGARR